MHRHTAALIPGQPTTPALRRLPSKAFRTALVALAATAFAGTASAQCGEDSFEDNDSCGQSLAISSPFTSSGLVAYKTDPDYWTLTVPAGQELSVDVFFDHDTADIDLYVYDLNGACGGILSFLDRSTSSSDDERLTWENTGSSPIDVSIKVEIWPGSIPTCNTYDFLVTVAPPFNPCDAATNDDNLEDNDSCSQTVALPIGTTNALWASRSDSDFYHATVQPGEALDVSALFIDSVSDVDLFLYDANGPCGGGFNSGELTSGFTQNDNEQVIWSNTGGTPRDVILEVDVFNSDNCNTYDLIVNLTGGGVGSNYCQANANSTGLQGLIRASGTTSVGTNNLRLQASQLPQMAFGFFINSRMQGFTPDAGGSMGNLCLSGNVGRHDGNILNSGGNGSFALTIDLSSVPQPMGAVSANAGETWNFQAWHRDAVNGSVTSNFTNGVRVQLTN